MLRSQIVTDVLFAKRALCATSLVIHYTCGIRIKKGLTKIVLIALRIEYYVQRHTILAFSY